MNKSLPWRLVFALTAAASCSEGAQTVNPAPHPSTPVETTTGAGGASAGSATGGAAPGETTGAVGGGGMHPSLTVGPNVDGGADAENGCETSNCSGFNDSCNCSGQCGTQFVQVSCMGDAAGMKCECRVGAVVVSTCTAPSTGGSDACSITTGCCAKALSQL